MPRKQKGPVSVERITQGLRIGLYHLQNDPEKINNGGQLNQQPKILHYLDSNA